MNQKSALIISITSDIGTALALRLKQNNWKVFGTYRTSSATLEELKIQNIKFFPCDLSDVNSIKMACEWFIKECGVWDLIVFAQGSMQPIGLFKEVNFEDWEESLQINCIRPLRIFHTLISYKNKSFEQSLIENHKPTVLFFAGGGANNAVVRYSSYTLSKIALTKMCELLDAEEKECRFAIVGPGWVKTKIHEETLSAKESAGQNYQKTVEKLNGAEWTSMNDVIDCCEWIITSPSSGISGRNFSVAYDFWGSKELEQALNNDPDMYKLRRSRNQWKPVNMECQSSSN